MRAQKESKKDDDHKTIKNANFKIYQNIYFDAHAKKICVIRK